MKWTQDDSKLYLDLEPIVKGMGYSIVELAVKETKFGLQVRAVIYHYSGVGVKDCETVYRAIMPRIEMLEETENVNLEVTSPGITRNIKNAAEFSVFIDRAVRILLESEEWITGYIVGANPDTVTLQTEENMTEIPVSDIRKAKLTVK
ncbi:MAG: ribosome maturation factor RimP [Spirochaetia bacterium]